MTGEDVAARVHAYAWTDRKPGLERTRALLAALGNPEKALKFVHITGSNGKGSTAAMLASVLAAAGYRTGLFTSPHLYRFNERFQVNGAPIPDAALDRLAERVLAAADTLPEHPTEFELMTAIGFLWFAEAGCDLVVVEVGLGGGRAVPYTHLRANEPASYLVCGLLLEKKTPQNSGGNNRRPTIAV